MFWLGAAVDMSGIFIRCGLSGVVVVNSNNVLVPRFVPVRLIFYGVAAINNYCDVLW